MRGTLRLVTEGVSDHDHRSDGGHDHGSNGDHDHRHDGDHADLPQPIALRVKAIQSLLIDKGIVEQATLDRIVDTYEHRVGPHLGATVVARAWVDEAFRRRLLTDGTQAVAELGIGGFRQGARLVALENTPAVHNVVVCTLCSCYPSWLLGLPPIWYKSAPYRSRTVFEPRAVLAEFGTDVGDDVEVRVWDSNSEVRYLVVPQRPANTDGWTVDRLASLVDRNAMIGVGRALPAGAAAEAG
jgi:nitrile hydratase subunit alpha